jgi:hypothetical protein
MTTGWRSWAGAERFQGRRFQGRRFQGRRFQGRAVSPLITMWGPSVVSRTLPSPDAVITVGPVEIAGSSAATRHQPFGSDPPPSTPSTPSAPSAPSTPSTPRTPAHAARPAPVSRSADQPMTVIKSCGHLPSPYDTKRPQTLITGIGRPETPSALTPLGHLPERYPCGSPAVPPPHPPHSRDDQPRPDPWPDDGTDESGHHHHPPMAPGRSPATSGWVRLGQHAYREPRPTAAGRDRWCSHARGPADGSGRSNGKRRSTANGAQRQTALKR